MRVKCLAQEHNTMSLVRARTQTTQPGVEHTNHKATMPPTMKQILARKENTTCIVNANRQLQKRERTGKEYGCFPFV